MDYKVAPGCVMCEMLDNISTTEEGFLLPEDRKNQWARVVLMPEKRLKDHIMPRWLHPGMYVLLPTMRGQVFGNHIVISQSDIKVAAYARD